MCGWLAIVMRQKAFLLFMGCVFLTSMFMILLPARRQRTLKTLVKETQDKINNLRDNLISAGESLDTNDGVSVQPELKYLQLLGLSPAPHSSEFADDELLIVTAVESDSADMVPGFIRSVAHHQPDANLLIYDLGVSRSNRGMLHRLCNSTQCSVAEFKFSDWPNHVRELKLKAYRPISIALGLRESNFVLWMDLDTRFTTNDLSPWITKVKESGVVAWTQAPPTKDWSGGSDIVGSTPTTALTHPKMFEYFPNLKKEDFEFQHMVSGRCLLFYPTPIHPDQEAAMEVAPSARPPSVSEDLLVPWIKCILIEDCINPIGAQSSGCRFDKKPQYRYSGCHSYDVSALNIVLGEMFSFHESRYISTATFWRRRRTKEPNQSPSTNPHNISDYGLA